MLSEEFLPPDVDLVTYLPRCPEVAARAYAKQAELPFETRVLQDARRAVVPRLDRGARRKNSIDQNLHLLPGMAQKLKGKTVVLIDDSIVRGNNSKRACGPALRGSWRRAGLFGELHAADWHYRRR